MATTEITTVDPAGFVALAAALDDVRDVITENLGGIDIDPSDLVALRLPSGNATTYRWEVPTLEGSEAVEEVRGIVVLHQQTRAWWPLSIDDGGSGNPPSCRSEDGKIGRGKQWATAADLDPDGDPAEVVCASCPHAQFGSDPDGPGQWCQQKVFIFVLGETGFLPFVIRAPAKSLKPWRRYMMQLGSAGIPYSSVVTGFRLSKDKSSGGTEHAVIEPYLAARLDPVAIERAKAYAADFRPIFQAVVREDNAAGEPQPADGGAGQSPAGPPPTAADHDDEEIAA